MRLKVNAGNLRSVGRLIDKVVGESIVEIRDGDVGMYVEQNNPENTMFLKLEVPSDFFEVIDVDGTTKFGANWNRVNDVLGNVDTENVIIESTENGQLKFSEERNEAAFEYEMAMIDTEAIKSAEIPDLDESEFEFTAEVSELKNGTGAISLVGNCFDMIVEEGYVKAHEQGDTDTVKKPIVEVNESYDGSSRFNKKFLDNFIKNIDSSIELDIEIGDDYPIHMSGVGSDNIDMECVLAPRK